MKRILSQCVKELAQFSRDRLTLALAFVLPMMTLLIFGFAIRLEAKDIPLLVQDFDRSVLSQEYSDRLFATNLFIPCGEPCREIITAQSNPEVALDRSFVKAIIAFFIMVRYVFEDEKRGKKGHHNSSNE